MYDEIMRFYSVTLIIISTSLAILLSSLINLTYAQVNETSQTQTYENRDIGIRLSYPSEWGSIIEGERTDCSTDASCTVRLDPTSGSPIGMSIGKFTKEECECNSLMDFVKWTYQRLAREKGFSFINDSQYTIGKNYSGWQYQFSILDNGNTRIGRSVQVGNNDNYYGIYTSYPNESRAIFLPKINKVIDSIEFLPIQVAKTPSFMNANETELSQTTPTLGASSNGLQILSHNSFTDSIGYMHVVGEIKNNSPSSKTFVKITGTFYDANNQVVGTDFAYADPYDLGSGQKAPFELILTSASIPISQIDHYNLQATYD